MKKAGIIIVALFLLMLNQSCKKCTSCYYTVTSPSGVKTTEQTNVVCGSKSDIEEFKRSVSRQAAMKNTVAVCTNQ
jgi:hypothetical protein